jgi:aquaporin Z
MFKKFLAEFIGTFLLVFLCCGAASFTAGYQGYLGVVGIAMIFGLVLTGLCYTIGHVSGSHVNPAVSIAMWVAGRMETAEFFVYICAQFLGGIAAGFSLYGLSRTFSSDRLALFMTNGYDLTSLGTNGYGSASSFLEISALGAAIVEVILTFFFVWVVLTVTAKKENQAISGVVIGAALTAVHLFGIPLTGTSVNPARSFGPALAVYVCKGDATALSQSVVFILGPLVGGILAAFVYALFSTEGSEAAAEAVGEAEETLEAAEAAGTAEEAENEAAVLTGEAEAAEETAAEAADEAETAAETAEEKAEEAESAKENAVPQDDASKE